MGTDWKDYYRILAVNPDSSLREIRTRYRSLSSLYKHLAASYPNVADYSHRLSQVEEAFGVLSRRQERKSYDHVYQIKIRDELVDAGDEFSEAIAQVAEQVRKRSKPHRNRLALKIPRKTLRIGIAVIASVLIVGIAGTSVTFAYPDNAAAAPFRESAVALARTSARAIGLVEDVRAVAASHERSVISEMLQSMRVDLGLTRIPAVTVPTNDMSAFPSPEHPLYPMYLDRQFSGFKYTVDRYGIVQVDASTATTDALLHRIEEKIMSLENP